MVASDINLLLYKVAQAYYEDGHTQQHIAQRLGYSRPKVSRLLSEAKNRGIVNITIAPLFSNYADLECRLEKKFRLKEAVVATVSNPDDFHAVSRELGPFAVGCLVRRIMGGEIIGITWGRTIMAMIESLPVKDYPNLTVVQISGGLGVDNRLEHSIELARRMASNFNAKLRLINSPGIVSNKSAAQAIKSDRHISETLRLAASSDIAIFGMGVLSSEAVLISDGTILSARDLKELKREKAVGDIALRYIGANGEPINSQINERIVGLTLSQIKKIPTSIVVAGGREKYDIIRAGLKGNIFNILVTDQLTAQKLVDEP